MLEIILDTLPETQLQGGLNDIQDTQYGLIIFDDWDLNLLLDEVHDTAKVCVLGQKLVRNRCPKNV